MEKSYIEKKINTVHTHRVGSITAGLSMIIWGVMFALNEVGVIGKLEVIVRLWPLILVSMGVEVLWSNTRSERVIYDKGAIFIMIVMMFMAMAMAAGDMMMKYI